MLNADQVLAYHKANTESLFGLTGTVFAGFEKLVQLNLTAAKATLGEAATTTQTVLSLKDPQEFLSLQTALAQPLAEKSAAYGRHVYDIATATGTEISTVVQQKIKEAQDAQAGLIEALSKNAPAGTEPVVAAFKSSTAAVVGAYESMQKAVKQATDMAEAGFATATATATNAVKASTTARKR